MVQKLKKVLLSNRRLYTKSRRLTHFCRYYKCTNILVFMAQNVIGSNASCIFVIFFISQNATVAPGYRQQVTRILSVNEYIPKIPQKNYLFRFPSTPLNWFSIKQLSKNNTAPKKNQKNIITVKQIVATCLENNTNLYQTLSISKMGI